MSLEELMKRKRLTQKDLAAKLGVSQPAISSWMHGLYMPRANQIKPLAKILGVSVGMLVEALERNKI